MDYRFKADEEAFRQEVKDFIRKELPPSIYKSSDAYTEENFEASMAFRRKLGTKGWIGIGWPKEYGGLGASVIKQMLFHEEMIYHNAPLDPQAYQVGPAIIHAGSEELKKRFLGATARQEIIWCQGFSEPNAGSDLASLQTRAVRDGDWYVINGDKIWTSYAHRATWIHLLARTNPEVPKHKGISYFVLEMKTPGITVKPLINMAGDHDFNQVYFDNVRVPASQMIGEENQGWYIATVTLDNERSGIRDVAKARRQLDELTEALHDTSLRGIRHDDVTRHKVAELAIEVQTSQMLSYRVGWMQSVGQRPTREASMAKLFATELQQRIARVAMETTGLYGQLLSKSKYAIMHGLFPYHAVRSIPSTIAAGSSEVNRNIVAQRGLGLPR